MLIATGARVAVYSAIAEARRTGASQVDTRHLLIGLIAGDDPATRGVWRQLGVDIPTLRAAVAPRHSARVTRETAMRHGASARAPSLRRKEASPRPSAFTADARRVLSDALVRARQRDARALSAVHLLLAIAAHHATHDGRGLLALLGAGALDPLVDAVHAEPAPAPPAA